MSSFSDLLAQSTTTTETTSANDTSTNEDNGIMLLSATADDGYTVVSGYTWISDYTDSDYSTVDALKNIKVSSNQISLTQEENSQVIPFELPRYYDGIDLTKMTFQIHYVNSDGYESLSTPINVMCNDTKIRFYWLVDSSVTALAGKVRFEITALGKVQTDAGEKNYIWKTRPSDGINILESLSGNGGTIEPSQGWDTYLQQVSNLVAEANSAKESAKQSATQAQTAADTVDTKISNVSEEITENVIASMEEELAKYYTKEEVDAKVEQAIEEMDFSEVLEEVQTKIDAIDGLSAFNSTYDAETGVISFYNGETLMTSHTLMTNPTDEWTNNLKEELQTSIDTSVKEVSDSLDEYKTSNDAEITNIKNNYYTKEETDSLVEGKADSSTVSELSSKVTQIESTSSTNKSNITAISAKITEIENAMNGFNTDPTVRYRATYDSETGLYSLIEITEGDDGEDVETPVSQFTITGGGGGTSTSTTVTIDRITSSPLTITKNDKALITYNFTSVDSSGDDTGEGTATWKIGNTVVATSIALQGENTFDLTDYVSVGTQKVTLTIVDAAGTLSVKTWTIQMVDVRIESSFNDQYTYPIGDVSFDYTPYGSISKTVHFILDGTEIGTVDTTSSGIPASYVIPAQTHGAHLLEAYITAELNNSTIETNHIYKDILWYDETSDVPVIGCIYQNITAKQYDSTNITYVVYDPSTETPKVTLAVDGDVVSSRTLETATNVWVYKSSDIGTHTLTITCGETVKTIIVTIEKLDINVTPVTANLAFDFNPSGYSNNSSDRLWTNGTVSMSVSDNFDWVNGGYQLDDNGDQYFCVKAGTEAVIDYNLFADDARKNGKEFKIIFKTANVRTADATFLSCQSGTTLIGLQMNVHEAYVKASVDSLYLPYSEEDIIEFDVNIFKEEEIPLVLHYEDGTPGRTMLYSSDYSFTQTSPVPITIGSADCDVHIYRMKAYSSALTDSGILSNFIADARNADEMIARHDRNQIYNENNVLTPESVAAACPDVKVIKIDCPHFTNDKSDFVKGTNIQCIHTGGDAALDNWTATNCYHSGQGTTSNEYGQAGRNLDILMCFDGNYTNKKITYDETYITQLVMGDNTKYTDGTGKVTLTRTSVPANYFNIKVNIASSENANNAYLAKRFNDGLPYQSPAQKRDSKVKNTMEFVQCVVFVREYDTDLTTHREFDDTEWHFYALGNIGDSKKTDVTRVNDPTDHKEFVVEIMDNTFINSTFSGTDEALAALDADTFNEKGTYGFRYEHDDITDEEQEANMQVWRDFYRFVVQSTDEEFVANLGNWFIVDSALYFYLFTERYTMIDNRAKNTFWHYGRVYITQEQATAMGDEAQYYTIDDEAAAINDGYRFDFWDYDNDSSLGINNTGELTMPYGKEDVDYRTDGDPTSGYIFNAADSTFFCRIRDLMYDELSAMFINRESQNCWSSDSLINQFDNAQNQFPEELWRLDFIRKYRRTYEEGTERFLKSMSQGKKKYHRRQWERDNEKYFATKYFGNTATSDQIMFRCNTPSEAVVAPNYTLHITPYSDMYVSVLIGATYRLKVRAKAGEEVVIPQQLDKMDDTAVLIYCASRIQDLGDLSSFYIHDNDFSKATKLKVLTIGNTTEGYSNTFLTNLTVGNNRLLEILDIRNTPSLTTSINLSGCSNLEELYAEGSGVTGVVFANGGKLRVAHLPALTSLTAKNLIYIEDWQVDSYENMQTLIVEYTDAIDTYEVVTSAPNLTNVRLLGIDWGTDEGITDTSILDRLIKIAGIDSAGYNTIISVLSGYFYSPTVKQKLLADYQAAWPDLVITYDTLVAQYTVTFVNTDGTVLDVQYVDKGGSAVDPVTRADNPIPTPTRASSISSDYTFSGWDLALNNVFANRTITATYTESTRQYTVKYVAKGVTLQETKAPYGSSVIYTGDTPTYTDEESGYVFYLFTGWDKFGLVDGDKTINAVYDRFEYQEGCFDGIDISAMTPVQIYALTKVKLEQSVVELKDSITFNMGLDYSYEDIEEKEIISEETVFSGSNYIDTGIKLLETDTSWTLAIDYSWDSGNSNNSTLMQCYQGDGSNGFRLWYSSEPKASWGTSSISAAAVSKRDVLVLRHVKGETKLHVYKGNLPELDVDYTELTASRATAATSTLVLGCARADDGVYENYAKGTVYWCKLWYEDLGNDACEQLALWTHESLTLEMCGFRNYYLSDGSGSKSSMTFLASHLLSNKIPLHSTNKNSGGWAETSLNLFLNSRFYDALPVEWKQIIKQVKIPSSIGDNSTEISTSDCYIAIPSIVQLESSMNFEPYSNEGTPITYMTSNTARVRKFPNGTANAYWTRSPYVDQFNIYYWNVDSTGNIESWANPASSDPKAVLIELSI